MICLVVIVSTYISMSNAECPIFLLVKCQCLSFSGWYILVVISQSPTGSLSYPMFLWFNLNPKEFKMVTSRFKPKHMLKKHVSCILYLQIPTNTLHFLIFEISKCLFFPSSHAFLACRCMSHAVHTATERLMPEAQCLAMAPWRHGATGHGEAMGFFSHPNLEDISPTWG